MCKSLYYYQQNGELLSDMHQQLLLKINSRCCCRITINKFLNVGHQRILYVATLTLHIIYVRSQQTLYNIHCTHTKIDFVHLSLCPCLSVCLSVCLQTSYIYAATVSFGVFIVCFKVYQSTVLTLYFRLSELQYSVCKSTHLKMMI